MLNNHDHLYINPEVNKINANVKLPKSTKIYTNCVGVFIAGGVKIGENCTIYHHVTIGKRGGNHTGVPIIGNNVKICSYACILGDVKIGDNSVIGAYTLVLKDIHAGSLAVGNPCKVIPLNKNKES